MADEANPFGDVSNPFGDPEPAPAAAAPSLIDTSTPEPAPAAATIPVNPDALSFQDFSATAPPAPELVNEPLQPTKPAQGSQQKTVVVSDAPRTSTGDEAEGLLGGSGTAADPRASVVGPDPNASFYSLAYYRHLFDVDEGEVGRRLFRAILPINPLLRSKDGTELNADLWGPFWVCTTLIFLITVTTNMVHYLSFEVTPDQKEWHNDFNMLLLASTIVYCYASVIPLGIYFAFKYTGVDAKLIDLVCYYGYCLVIFIPVSVLSVIPQSFLRWVLALLAFAVSSIALGQNIGRYYSNAEGLLKGAGAVLLGCFILHAGFALSLKLLFFHV